MTEKFSFKDAKKGDFNGQMEFRKRSIDSRRTLIVPGDKEATLTFCVQQIIDICTLAINTRGLCTLALSGGSTPQALFALLPAYKHLVDWTKVHLFWSDERSVPPEDPDSNYGMAMRSGLNKLPIPEAHIHRMIAEKDIEENARLYEKTVDTVLQGKPFDLIMLGLGEDGHIASLFPNTDGLHIKDRKILAQFVPQKNTWRMSMSFPCLENSHHTVIYVLGSSKASILQAILFKGYECPAQHVGTPAHPVLWIADSSAVKAPNHQE